MKITFIEEDNSIFAVAQNVEKGGKFYDEILYAEILQKDGKIFVIFEDDWQNKLPFENLKTAEEFVKNNYHKHNGHVNGNIYNID